MGHPILCGRARNTRLPFDLSLVFITLGEPQAHGDTAEAVPFLETELSRRLFRPISSGEDLIMPHEWRSGVICSSCVDLDAVDIYEPAALTLLSAPVVGCLDSGSREP